MGTRARWWGCVVAAVVACSGSGGGGGATPASGGGASGGAAGSGAGSSGGSTAGTGGVGSTGTGGPGDGTASGGGSGTSTTPPFTAQGWTFYGTAQGLSADVHDVSADEAGNVYVAGGDALYAKRKDETAFRRFDAATSSLTRNCYEGVPPESDPGFAAALDRSHPQPPGAPKLCPVLSVAGGASGVAMIGLQGHGTDGDLDADWAQDSGGADLVAFDGTSVQRTRHVFIASPPQSICVMPDASGQLHEQRATSCPNPPDPFFWQVGRRKLRQVFRIAANHQQGSPLHGDFFMGGAHSSITAYLHDSATRGYLDRTVGQPAKWADAKDVWEHDHPAFYSASLNAFLTGYTYALAVDPQSGTPWCSNGYRTAWLQGYGADLHDDQWYLRPVDAATPLWLEFWPSNAVHSESVDDHVESLSFCDDGTLWIGSSVHGLVRRAPGGGLRYFDLPDPAGHGDSVYAVACDPSDHSVWIGLGWGGVMRLSQDGKFTAYDVPGAPDFARQPVRSIQIDRWSGGARTVYVAFLPLGARPGGVGAYAGP